MENLNQASTEGSLVEMVEKENVPHDLAFESNFTEIMCQVDKEKLRLLDELDKIEFDNKSNHLSTISPQSILLDYVYSSEDEDEYYQDHSIRESIGFLTDDFATDQSPELVHLYEVYKLLENKLNEKNESIKEHTKALTQKVRDNNYNEEYTFAKLRQRSDLMQRIIYKFNEDVSKFRDKCQDGITEIRSLNLSCYKASLNNNLEALRKIANEEYEKESYRRIIDTRNSYNKYENDLVEIIESELDQYASKRTQKENELADLISTLEDEIIRIKIAKEQVAYNLIVLRERQQHNYQLINTYKGAISRARNSLYHQKLNYKTALSKNIAENQKLTKRYLGFVTRYKHLKQTKNHIQNKLQLKFLAIWKYKEKQALTYQTSLKQMAIKIDETYLQNCYEHTNIDDLRSEQGSQMSKISSNFLQTLSTKLRASSNNLFTSRFSISKISKVLELILEECTFLITAQKTQEDENIDKELKTFEKYFELLQCLSIETQEDLDALVQLFFPGQEEDDENMCIENEEVLSILKKYLEDKKTKILITQAWENENQDNKSEKGDHKDRSILMTQWENEVKAFWEKKNLTIPLRKINNWEHLQGYIKQHYLNLLERENLYKEVMLLNQENEELNNFITQNKLS